MVNQGAISRPPVFGIVTNGSSREHSREMVALCKEYAIGTTVSLDGYKRVHDALRPNAQGFGTFDDAIETISALLNAQIPVAIETVYTSVHIDERCSIVDLLKFTESLGVKKLIFHTAYPPAPLKLCPFDDAHFERLLNSHLDAVNWWFDSLLNERKTLVDIYFKDLLLSLLHGAGAGVGEGGCPAGTRDLSIGPDGDVYSCHLLYKMPQYRLGNVFSDDYTKREIGLPLRVDDLPNCAGCFARYWCQPCGALNASWGDAWMPEQRECALRRAVILRIGALAFKHLAIPDNMITNVLRRATEDFAGSMLPI